MKEEQLEARLTRNELEKLCTPLFVEMRSALDRCCWQAGVDLLSLKEMQKATEAPQQKIPIQKHLPVTEILLVGAATKMPAIGRFLQNMTGLEVRESNIDPDHCVAMGAAIEAAHLSGQLGDDFMVMDLWQASLMRALAKDEQMQE